MDLYISLKDLSAIAGKYDLRRDVRAEAEINNKAVAGDVVRWTPVSVALPESPDGKIPTVLACVTGYDKESGHHLDYAYVWAEWYEDAGWCLIDYPFAEFTVWEWLDIPDAQSVEKEMNK